MTIVSKIPRGILTSKACERHGDIEIILNKTLIEIDKPEE
jgi:hypothetical protein